MLTVATQRLRRFRTADPFRTYFLAHHDLFIQNNNGSTRWVGSKTKSERADTSCRSLFEKHEYQTMPR